MPAIGLLELLLLGAPDGKTELIDGRVYRHFLAPSEAIACDVFAAVRADLKGMFGTISDHGPDACDLGRLHLVRTGRRVELEVDVSRETFLTFSRM